MKYDRNHRCPKALSAGLCVLLMTAALLSALTGCGTKEEYTVGERDERGLTPQQNAVMSLSGSDALGRTWQAADAKKDGERYVGVFYSLWLGQHPELTRQINNIQELIDDGEDGLAQLNDVSDYGQFYFWGEPLYGYYSMTDRWVVTRHMELLTMAGVDFLCIDATNKFIYEDVVDVLMSVLTDFSQQGFDVPKVSFYTNTDSATTVDKLYAAYYEAHPEWDDLWFKPHGKPLIVATTKDNNNASDMVKYGGEASYVGWKMKEYFEIRESQWPNGDNNDNGLPWMSWEYPQYIHNGAIACPVAQHSHTGIDASLMHPESSRAYNNVTGRVEDDWTAGRSFQDMWDTVHANDDKVTLVLCASFNEWQAQHLGPNKFVDVYNHEYSRDIEMMKGGYGDNYYLQLLENVRRYKYTDAAAYALPMASVRIEKGAGDPAWDRAVAYADFVGDCMTRRHFDAAGTYLYRDDSNRNDIAGIRVIHDEKNLYVRVTCAEEITAYEEGDAGWMNLLLSTGADESFAGFDFIVNRSPSDGKTSIEQLKDGEWKTVGTAGMKLEGKDLFLSIPWSVLDVQPGSLIRFKAADNVTEQFDIMDYYVSGDSAPIGRLAYSYGYAE